jgi:hypothetical protein
MTSIPQGTPRGPSAAPDGVPLDRLVDLLDDATVDEAFVLQPRLVQLRTAPGCPEEVELAVKTLDGNSVTTALMGFVAPPECIALAAVTGAWAAPATDADFDETDRGRFPSTRPSAHPDAVRARSILVVSRSGGIAGRIHCADGRILDHDEDGGPLGFTIDGLRRAFALPTAPPAIPTTELLTTLWLVDIADAGQRARTRGRRLTWPAAAKLHLAFRILRAAGDQPHHERLVPAARALGRVLTWSEVRRQATRRGWLSGIVTADLASWMDEGMLARWLLAAFNPLPELLADARAVLRPDARPKLAAAVAELACEGEAA